MFSKFIRWGHFFSRSHPTEETPEEKERRLVYETFQTMCNKLDFIETDLKSTFPDQADAFREITQPIHQIKASLIAVKTRYDQTQIDLNGLKQEWHDVINNEETGILTVEVHLKMSSMVYHKVHQLIQDFLKWSQAALQNLGVLSTPSAEDAKRTPWIREKENAPKDIEEIRQFEKGLDTSSEKEDSQKPKR